MCVKNSMNCIVVRGLNDRMNWSGCTIVESLKNLVYEKKTFFVWRGVPVTNLTIWNPLYCKEPTKSWYGRYHGKWTISDSSFYQRSRKINKSTKSRCWYMRIILLKCHFNQSNLVHLTSTVKLATQILLYHAQTSI